MFKRNGRMNGVACPEDEEQASFGREATGKREVRISSLVYSEHRERSESGSKVKRKGLSLVSAQKRSRESSVNKSRKEYPLRTESSFMDINDSIIVKIKENQPQTQQPVQIRQPQFHRSHPIFLNRINGTCLSKLIAQKAIKQKQYSFTPN